MQIAALREDIAQGNVAHAYLFTGPEHVGKTAVAKQFAVDLLTIDASDEERRDILRQVERLTHPDLLVLDRLWVAGLCEDWDVIAQSSNAPQEHRSTKSAPAKTDTIGIEDIRALQERLYEKPLAPYRCCILAGADRMQDAAANALLKILEEPPERLVFLLTAASSDALPETLVSRVRRLRFHGVSGEEISSLLEGIPDDDASFIRQCAQGAPGLAIALRDDPERLRLERQTHAQAHAFWESATLQHRLQVLAELSERGMETDRLLFHLASTLREQPVARSRACAPLLARLMALLQTNAYRPLVAAQFALQVQTIGKKP